MASVILATALAQFAFARVLNWSQVARLLELARADTEQALRDQDLFRAPDEGQARHVAIVYQMLKTAPFGDCRYEPRSFATFVHAPDPDYRRRGDTIDVDPSTVPDSELPSLAVVS